MDPLLLWKVGYGVLVGAYVDCDLELLEEDPLDDDDLADFLFFEGDDVGDEVSTTSSINELRAVVGDEVTMTSSSINESREATTSVCSVSAIEGAGEGSATACSEKVRVVVSSGVKEREDAGAADDEDDPPVLVKTATSTTAMTTTLDPRIAHVRTLLRDIE